MPVPAFTMREVFDELADRSKVKLRWLAVDGQAMNVGHKPRDDFEKAAAEALAARKLEYEATADGVYRHAGAITLKNDCLKCHIPDRTSTEDRTAGLIIEMPIKAK